MLSFYPGGIWFDTWLSIIYAVDKVKSDRHPYFYNYFISLIVNFADNHNKGMTWVCASLMFVQVVLFIAVINYFVYWMIQKKVNKYIVVIAYIVMVFALHIPYMGFQYGKIRRFVLL